MLTETNASRHKPDKMTLKHIFRDPARVSVMENNFSPKIDMEYYFTNVFDDRADVQVNLKLKII